MKESSEEFFKVFASPGIGPEFTPSSFIDLNGS